MHDLRIFAAPLRSPDTYRRWLHLVLGGVLYMPFYVAVAVIAWVVFYGSLPASESGVGAPGVIAIPLAAVAGGAVALIPAVQAQQGQLARTLVRGPLASEPSVTSTAWHQRLRSAAWAVLHLLVGFGVSMATMILLTDAALLAAAPLATEPVTVLEDVWAPLGLTTGDGRWFGPLAGVALVLALVYGVAFVGALAARLAPVLLGPSVADRLAAAQARAHDLSHRNRLAADLHDSLGHALSVVTLQAGAAARVIDQDPAFARDALAAIAEQARTATAELDHVLGLLRDEPPATAPQRTLHDLVHLVEAARSTGTDLRLTTSGPLDEVPPAVSREVFRLGQEGLTNALRHGEGTHPITIHLDVEAARLRLTVANGASARARRRGGGRGLLAMAERVRLLGGHLDAGEQDGTWRLDATIPWDRASAGADDGAARSVGP